MGKASIPGLQRLTTGDWLAGAGALETEGKEYVGDFVQGLKQGLGVLI